MIQLVVPIRIESEMNRRDHWAARYRRFKSQKKAVGYCLLAHRVPDLPVTVTMTRVAPKALDTDNLAGGMKAVRDAIAAWLAVDDADMRVIWICQQRRGKAYALEIEITPTR